MTLSEIKMRLGRIFPKEKIVEIDSKSAAKPPFATYYEDFSTPIGSDNIVFARRANMKIEFCSFLKNDNLEKQIEFQFSDAGYTKEKDYDDINRVYMTKYSFETIIRNLEE